MRKARHRRLPTLWTVALAALGVLGVATLILLSQAPVLAETDTVQDGAQAAVEAEAPDEAPAPSLCLGIDDPTEAALAGCSICLDNDGIGSRCCCNASGAGASCSCTGSGNQRVCTCKDSEGTVRCAYTSNGSDCACTAVAIISPDPVPTES